MPPRLLSDLIDERLADAGAGATTLNGLSDVSTVGAVAGQALVTSDGVNWTPGSVAATSGITSVNGDSGTGGAVTLTYNELSSVLTVTSYSTPIDVSGYSDVIFDLTDDMTGVQLVWPDGVYAINCTVKQDVGGDNNFSFGTDQVNRWPGGAGEPVYSREPNDRTTFTLFKYSGSGNGTGVTVNGFHAQSIKSLFWAFPPGQDAVLNSVGNSIRIHRPHRLLRAQVTATAAPTGASVLVDLNAGSTSVWALNQGNRATLPAGALLGTATTTFDGSYGSGATYHPVIDQIGSTLPGEGITFQLEYLEG